MKSVQTDNTKIGLDNVNYYIKGGRRIVIRANKYVTKPGNVRNFSNVTTSNNVR